MESLLPKINEWFVDETASWAVLCCWGSLLVSVLYPWLPLMRALVFDTVAWWYRTVPHTPLSVLGPPGCSFPCVTDLFHGVPLPWLPEKLPGYLQSQGWVYFFCFGLGFFFVLQESLFGEYSHVACVPTLCVHGLLGKRRCSAGSQL